jgi:hypothetical protein
MKITTMISINVKPRWRCRDETVAGMIKISMV